MRTLRSLVWVRSSFYSNMYCWVACQFDNWVKFGKEDAVLSIFTAKNIRKWYFWSFVWKTLLNQRPKAHDSCFTDFAAENRIFWLKTAVFMKTVDFEGLWVGLNWQNLPKTAVFGWNHRFWCGFWPKTSFQCSFQFVGGTKVNFDLKKHGFHQKPWFSAKKLWFSDQKMCFSRFCVVFEFKTRKLLISSLKTSVFYPKPELLYCVPNWLLSRPLDLILSLCSRLTPFKTIWPNFIIVYPIDSFQDHMTWFSHCVPSWLLSRPFDPILSLCTQLIPFKIIWPNFYHCVPYSLLSRPFDLILSLGTQLTSFKTIWPDFYIGYPIDFFQDHLT